MAFVRLGTRLGICLGAHLGIPGCGTALLSLRSGTLKRASNASYIAGGNSVVKVGNDAFRYEDLGDGNGAHLLLEGTVTNEIADSEDFSAWAPIGTISVTANSTSAPDGTTTADTVADTDVTTLSRTRQNVTLTGPSTVTTYILQDSDTSRFPEGVLYSGASTGSQLNTSTGATTDRIGVTVRQVQDIGNYHRFSISQSSATGVTAFELFPAITDVFGGTNVATTGSVVAWGCQVEANSFPSSYVASSGAPATKVADVLSFSTWPVDLIVGVYEFDFYPSFANNEVSSDVTLLSFGGNQDELRYVASTDTFDVVISGITRASTAAATFSRYQKLTLKLDWSFRQLTLTGATTGDGTVGIASLDNWPISVDLRIGGTYSGTREAFGRYSDIRSA